MLELTVRKLVVVEPPSILYEPPFILYSTELHVLALRDNQSTVRSFYLACRRKQSEDHQRHPCQKTNPFIRDEVLSC